MYLTLDIPPEYTVHSAHEVVQQGVYISSPVSQQTVDPICSVCNSEKSLVVVSASFSGWEVGTWEQRTVVNVHSLKDLHAVYMYCSECT